MGRQGRKPPGRPPAENPKTAVLTLRVEPELVGEIDALARRSGTTRSRLLRKMILSTLGREPEAEPISRQRVTEKAENPELEEWIARRAKQLRNQGMTTPLASREARREAARR